MWDSSTIVMILKGLLETIYMTFLSTFIAYIIGLPLGVLLVTSQSNGISPIPKLNKILNLIVNVVRSVPFLILLVAVIPITRFVVGSSIGSSATVVPLVIASAPFIARLVESSIQEVEKGVIEAAVSMGCSPFQIITKVMIPEAVPSLIMGAAIAATTILSYSAMAGFVGGGGLGDIAIRYGYHRYEYGIMIVTVAILVIIVQVSQDIGTKIAKKKDKRK